MQYPLVTGYQKSRVEDVARSDSQLRDFGELFDGISKFGDFGPPKSTEQAV